MGKSLLLFILLFVNAFNLALAENHKSNLTSVDTMIVISVDVSSSITSDEYEVQKQGVISAFRAPDIQELFRQCAMSGVGVTYVEWSGASRTSAHVTTITNVIPWTHIVNPEGLTAFADQLSRSGRTSELETDIADSLAYSRELFEQAPFESYNKIISLSTDGRQGFTRGGRAPEVALQYERDLLAEMEITINVIGIQKPEPDGELASSEPSFSFAAPSQAQEILPLKEYLEKNVRSGSRSMLEATDSFSGYAEIFKKQLTVMLNSCVS